MITHRLDTICYEQHIPHAEDWGVLSYKRPQSLLHHLYLKTLNMCKHNLSILLITHQYSGNICKSPVAQWSPRPTVTARRHIGRLEVRSFPGEFSFAHLFCPYGHGICYAGVLSPCLDVLCSFALILHDLQPSFVRLQDQLKTWH